MSGGRAGRAARSTRRPKGETAAAAVSGTFTEGVSQGSARRFLRTEDGVAIDAAYDPGEPAGGAVGTGLALVLAHGFTGDLERPYVRRVAAALRRHGAVVTFSFRGHGASGGHSTVGDREVLDLAAAVRWARDLGHTRVATVGFSMGGSVVLRHAALRPPGAETDTVVAVSSPARWYYRGTAPMRRLHWLVTRPVGRAVGRYGLRTRIHHRDWDPVPASPVESVPLIAPTPLLVVHGDRDGYFPLDHPRMLAEAAPGHAELWLERGMGHAENAAADELLERIGAWVAARAG
ncbi:MULTISPECIES: alpha/beta hydrolase [Streptomyces]|uniref:Alpha/beta hydrolase n=1 Tax=Streptomyces griseoaurantiacus TaxID=68213 RepID=A0ABZ1V478_9ACTN|nr:MULTISPECIES: alpha/beta fold hydrolase [Streptomyces]MDX3087586.1 alpha/beta fold hydrolase [Streptomyces sp. ME12-02E]MDX3330941.1 alpha/beta fold hydrolase [Streptomyces sp. ME02-6978a]MDX3359677.1 alpha/beta fold hydrolase [Streptomyces sp. ME02-6978.2a]NJP69447.1 alpha/beta hydrolase [Streptomyces sp. C1-2]WTI27596.1 alpha/beta hydrolase [Streptomyces jietaisiensis]